MVPTLRLRPSGCHATERTHPVLKLLFGMRLESSRRGHARAYTVRPLPGVMFHRRSVPSSEHVAILFSSEGCSATPQSSPLPCASTISRASSLISQISPHFVPTKALLLTSVVMELMGAASPDMALLMRIWCSGDKSSAFQNRTTPSSPPDNRTLCSCKQNTAFTFPACAVGTTLASFVPLKTYN